jgi:hypothetical protein
MNGQSISLLRRDLLGRQWECYVGCSGFCALMRTSRLNFLYRVNHMDALGVWVSINEDIFRRTCVSAKLKTALASAMATPKEAVKEWWAVAAWWPFAGAIPWAYMPWRLRLCPVCARSCYHSLLFQMPGVTRCPWHGIDLIEACPLCGRDLLKGSENDLPLGSCPCGHDFVDYVESIEGDRTTLKAKSRAINGYRTWAAVSRKTNFLISPEQWDPLAWKALDRLIVQRQAVRRLMQNVSFNPSDQYIHLEDVRVNRAVGRSATPLEPTSGLASGQPTYVSLPASWIAPLHHVGEELIRMLPTNAADRLNIDRRSRSSFKILPVFNSGSHVTMHTECLHRCVRSILARLAHTILAFRKGTLFADAPGQQVKGHGLGPELVRRLIHRVLLRGYADGARWALTHHVLMRHEHPRIRPAIRYPWIVLRFPLGRAPSGRIVWTRQS